MVPLSLFQVQEPKNGCPYCNMVTGATKTNALVQGQELLGESVPDLKYINIDDTPS